MKLYDFISINKRISEIILFNVQTNQNLKTSFENQQLIHFQILVPSKTLENKVIQPNENAPNF